MQSPQKMKKFNKILLCTNAYLQYYIYIYIWIQRSYSYTNLTPYCADTTRKVLVAALPENVFTCTLHCVKEKWKKWDETRWQPFANSAYKITIGYCILFGGWNILCHLIDMICKITATLWPLPAIYILHTYLRTQKKHYTHYKIFINGCNFIRSIRDKFFAL